VHVLTSARRHLRVHVDTESMAEGTLRKPRNMLFPGGRSENDNESAFIRVRVLRGATMANDDSKSSYECASSMCVGGCIFHSTRLKSLSVI
jgi:hypothetical protein